MKFVSICVSHCCLHCCLLYCFLFFFCIGTLFVRRLIGEVFKVAVARKAMYNVKVVLKLNPAMLIFIGHVV